MICKCTATFWYVTMIHFWRQWQHVWNMMYHCSQIDPRHALESKVTFKRVGCTRQTGVKLDIMIRYGTTNSYVAPVSCFKRKCDHDTLMRWMGWWHAGQILGSWVLGTNDPAKKANTKRPIGWSGFGLFLQGPKYKVPRPRFWFGLPVSAPLQYHSMNN